jgi:hypothetical protein
MRYMLLIHTDESAAAATPPEGLTRMSADYAAFTEAMNKAGVNLGGERLRPGVTSANVRVRDGRTEVLDGPYADTREQFGGYYLIDVPDLDQAVAWAARCPAAARGTVEVRAVWEMAGN